MLFLPSSIWVDSIWRLVNAFEGNNRPRFSRRFWDQAPRVAFGTSLTPSYDRTLGRRRILSTIACVALFAIALCAFGQGPPQGVGATGVGRASEDCDEHLPSDSLGEYARKCAAATGEDVPGFNCDD